MPANHYRLPRSSADGGFSCWWWWRKLSKRNGPSLPPLQHSPFSLSSSRRCPFLVHLQIRVQIQEQLLNGCRSRLHPKHKKIPPGGGWCSTLSSCSARRRTKLGSSTYMEHEVEFLGILSHDPLQNPDFFNWNKVKIRYCDGSSFSSHPDNEFGSGTKIFFRGQLIWDTVMDELLSIGMSKAREALLTGCSAGGLATLIHCDDFRSLLPKDANVKCLADAGFFLNEKDIAGNRTIESFYHDVAHLQGVAKSLNHDCITRSEPRKCFFLKFIGKIKTPIFLVQPAYDFWQIANILVPASSDPGGSWPRCKLNILKCDSSQLEVLHGYRNSLLKTLNEFQQNPEMGVFINSCFVHCQTWAAETWHSPTSPRINNKTVAESVGDWYFKRAAAKQIDCPYPCNPTCYNRDLTLG
ncbi:UNVERIFIED_CONTAM: Pectin acetylesterase 5 [Sesamum radiatum]|uniref:Pectin acetylesterase n=1 Tax=Sesamum radiatum TaxID=300843 RepID=A0AAW2NPW9_SESRA